MGTNLIHRAGQLSFASDARDPPRAPVRAMQVLEALASAGQALPLTGLSTALALPKTSLLQLLRALEAAGYVRRVAAGFELGEGSYRLASAIGGTDGFTGACQQVMEELLASTRETVLLGKLGPTGLAGIYVERRPSPQSMRFTPELNEDRPLYCTALGKVLLAFSPAGQVGAYLDSVKLERFTAHTVTSKRRLRNELAEVRHQGWALSANEMVEGGGALAAPVFDRAGSLRLALVVAAPCARLLPRAPAWAQLLQRGAARLSGMPGEVNAQTAGLRARPSACPPATAPPAPVAPLPDARPTWPA